MKSPESKTDKEPQEEQGYHSMWLDSEADGDWPSESSGSESDRRSSRRSGRQASGDSDHHDDEYREARRRIGRGESGDIDGPAEFYALNLVPFDDPIGKLAPPPAIKDMSERLRKEHLLILGGAEFADKHTLASQIIWNLKYVCQVDVRRPLVLETKEWLRGSDRPRLAAALRSTKSPTIYLLDQARPHHLEFATKDLRELARRGGHYLLVTTDFPREDWCLQPEGFDELVWLDLDHEDVYTPQYLARYLRDCLEGTGFALQADPSGRRTSGPADTDFGAIAPGLTVLESAIGLQSPDRVRAFVDWLRGQDEPLQAQNLRRQIQRLQGNVAAIDGWFRRLEPHHQLLMAFVALFDGLLEDQLLALLDIVLVRCWLKRAPHLAAYDHSDIEAIGSYVRRTDLGKGGVTLSTYSRAQRLAFLNVAWKLHRRQIVAAIPVLQDLANRAANWLNQRLRGAAAPQPFTLHNDSAGEKPSDETESVKHTADKAKSAAGGESYLSRWHDYGPERELYSTVARKAKLLQALADAFSVLGTLSRNAVERALHQIAANREWEVRQVTATAMARWRELADHDALLYHTLHHWQNEAWQKARGASKDTARGLAGIRATVVEVVAIALLFDPPNHMAEPLLQLIKKALPDRSWMVRRALKERTIPFAVAHHRAQLDPFVIELTERHELIEPIAIGWALFIKHRPEEGLGLLKAWQKKYSASQAQPHEPPSRNERCLAVLAATYGELETETAALDEDEILGRLMSFLKLKGGHRKHEHPFVRKYVIRALRRRIGEHLEAVPRYLRRVFAVLQLGERESIVEALRDNFLRQRAALADGNIQRSVKGKTYDFWSGRRPMTEIESMLHEWLADSEVPETQQLALAALVALHGTPVQREERRLEAEPPAEPETESKPSRPTPTAESSEAASSLRALDPIQALLLRLMKWFERQVPDGAQALASELIALDRQNPGGLEPVLAATSHLDGPTAQLGPYLRRFRRLFRWRHLLLATVGVSATTLVVLLLA